MPAIGSEHRVVQAVAVTGTLIAILLAIGLLWVFYAPNEFQGQELKSVYVSKGGTFTAIVDSLDIRGLIRSRPLFVFVAKVIGGEKHIRVGKYSFRSGISNVALFRALRDGSGQVLIPVTLREGLRSQLDARILARALGIDSSRYTALVHDELFVRSLGISAPSLEGYLLPETYNLAWQEDERDIIRRQVDQFKRIYNDSLRNRAAEIGWTTNQVLTLASIIEAEAVLPSERAIISGVYHNRLRKGMRLEADPTVQFALEEEPHRVHYKDLRTESPYNTYLHAGLPPGPINNPGKASVLAALFPAQHTYLYFVANGSGGHWFSTNFVDHTRHVRMYRRNRSQSQVISLSRSKSQPGVKSD